MAITRKLFDSSWAQNVKKVGCACRHSFRVMAIHSSEYSEIQRYVLMPAIFTHAQHTSPCNLQGLAPVMSEMWILIGIQYRILGSAATSPPAIQVFSIQLAACQKVGKKWHSTSRMDVKCRNLSYRGERIKFCRCSEHYRMHSWDVYIKIMWSWIHMFEWFKAELVVHIKMFT